MKRKVIVVGGGVAGLSAGVYALQCGFDVTVLEGHAIAGGNCTSWKRGEYLFEGGMHWLAGSHPEEPLNKLWRAVGALDDSVEIHYSSPFTEYVHDGVPLRFYRDVDQTEKYLISIAPADAKEIRRLCDNIRKMKDLYMPVEDVKGVKMANHYRPPLKLLFAALSALRLMRKFARISRTAYINRFTHEGLRNLLRATTHDSMGIAPLFFTLGELARGDGGFPEGGSLPFVERMVRRFEALGGALLCRTRALRVLVDHGVTTGVIAGGQTMRADAVIVSSDTMAIDQLFETPPSAPWLDQMRKVTAPTMNVLLSLGIDADLRRYPRYGILRLERPLTIDREIYEYISYTNYVGDSTYAPPGKTALTVSLPGDTYDFWKKAKAGGRYAAEKERVATAVVDILTANLPEIQGRVDVCDVATPLTYERYCGNWKGSWMTDLNGKMGLKSYPATIPGLGGVYFAGQRMTPPGGLPVALMSGRTAVQALCRDTDTFFVGEEC